MAKALSNDIRQRVVAVIDRGLSCRQAAERFRGERVERDPMA
jgi:transposase